MSSIITFFISSAGRRHGFLELNKTAVYADIRILSESIVTVCIVLVEDLVVLSLSLTMSTTDMQTTYFTKLYYLK